MSADELIQHYGNFAIAVGTFCEGETVMLAAGALAGAGLLTLPLAIASSMAGIFASDTVCFFAGRLAGNRLIRWFPRLHGRLAAVFRLIERHDQKLILGYHFIPGFCTVTPMAFGMTRISASRFLALDLPGNAAWTLAFVSMGYLFGEAYRFTFPAGRHGMLPIAIAIFIAGAAFFSWRRHRSTSATVDLGSPAG
jgi:membrane protein DedA with SNARE-associated domain